MNIKFYTCECGEDFYEDDEECCNCGVPIDKSKLQDEELPEIISQGEIKLARCNCYDSRATSIICAIHGLVSDK